MLTVSHSYFLYQVLIWSFQVDLLQNSSVKDLILLNIFRIPCTVRSQCPARLVSRVVRMDELFWMAIAWYLSSAWGRLGKDCMRRTYWNSSWMAGWLPWLNTARGGSPSQNATNRQIIARIVNDILCHSLSKSHYECCSQFSEISSFFMRSQVCLCLCLLVGQPMSCHHSDQLYSIII